MASKRPSSQRNPVPQDEQRIWSFVPQEEIDMECLAFYIRSFIDKNAGLKVGPHWKNRDTIGYWIHSTRSLSGRNILDIKLDSRDWDDERESFDGRYNDSRTARNRLREGRSPDQELQPATNTKSQSAFDQDYDRSRHGGQAANIADDRSDILGPLPPGQSSDPVSKWLSSTASDSGYSSVSAATQRHAAQSGFGGQSGSVSWSPNINTAALNRSMEAQRRGTTPGLSAGQANQRQQQDSDVRMSEAPGRHASAQQLAATPWRQASDPKIQPATRRTGPDPKSAPPRPPPAPRPGGGQPGSNQPGWRRDEGQATSLPFSHTTQADYADDDSGAEDHMRQYRD